MADQEQKVVYIGMAIPKVKTIPLLFNETVSNDLKTTAIKTSEFLKAGNLDLDGDVKMSVIPINEDLLNTLNKAMNEPKR